MTIDSHALHVFSALARHLNMSRAAEELELTPSGISHCLKSLESDLGCRLFERTSRKVALTLAGAEFREEADLILRRMSAARSRLKSWGDWRCGQLRIAAGGACCQHLLPLVLREFRESFPKFTVRIELSSSRQAAEGLLSGRVDLAFAVRPAQLTGLQFVPTAEDELHYLVHPRHPWVSQRKAERDDVSKQNLILPERASETHQLLEEYFRQEGLAIEPFIEVGHEETIKQFVQLNLGIGFLPRWLAAEELKSGALSILPLGRRRLRRAWGILHARSHKLTFPESVFVDLCRSASQSVMHDNN